MFPTAWVYTNEYRCHLRKRFRMTREAWDIVNRQPRLEAAEKLGITQPRISALMKGAWRDFSADMLLLLAARLDLRPTLKLAA